MAIVDRFCTILVLKTLITEKTILILLLISFRVKAKRHSLLIQKVMRIMMKWYLLMTVVC